MSFINTYRFYFITAFCFIALSTMMAQVEGEGIGIQTIRVQGQSDGEKILLRWIYDDVETWEKAIAHGITIRRITYAISDVVVPLNDQIANRVDLVSDQKPLLEGQWIPKYPDHDYAIAAEKLLYDNSMDVQVTGSPTFADALRSHELNENKLFFTHFLADADFDIAQDLVMGYADSGVLASEKYIYILSIQDGSEPEEIRNGATLVSLADIPTLPQPLNLEVEEQDKYLSIYWDIENVIDHYTCYDMYRSRDSVNFHKINTEPYVFAADDFDNVDRALYRDSVPQYGVPYYYKLRGHNPFGFEGPFSEVAKGIARPPRKDIELYIQDLPDDAEEAILKWGNLAPMWSSELVGFDIYRTADLMRPFEKINNARLNSTLREYEDTDPIGPAYYYLQAEDLYGHIYRSVNKLVQLPDTDPPHIPVGLSGIAQEGDRMLLSWQANLDKDIKGYRLYRCFSVGGEFAIIGDGTLADTFYMDDLTSYVITDSIFYRIEAYDLRSNTSGYSDPITIDRADVTPPANPTLYKAMPLPAGVSLAWRYSRTDDVHHHILRRKPSNSPNWTSLLEIPRYQEAQYEIPDSNSLTATCWIDDDMLNSETYMYQMLAYDGAGNSSGSEVITVLPYDSGDRSPIESFDVTADCTTTCSIDLNWSYFVNDQVSGFTIYRSRNNSSLSTYKTLDISDFNLSQGTVGNQDFTYTDTDVESGLRYIYQIVANHIGEAQSPASELLTIIAE